MTGTESFLTALLDCGVNDLRILDDVAYDWKEIIDAINETGTPPTLNNLLNAVFVKGLAEIQAAAKDMICELEAITKERELEADEEEELAQLRELNASKDFGSFCNCLDTSIYCKNHADIYGKYMDEVLDMFEQNTGFCIGGI